MDEDKGLSLVAFGVALLAIPFNGFVIFKLWTWFGVPLGWPQITILNALGLDLLFTFCIPSRKFEKTTGQEDLTSSFRIWLKGGFALGLGWIFHSLMIG